MSRLSQWLGELGLQQYEALFAANDIDFDALRHLTDQDLKDLGLSLGHRRKLLVAIAALAPPTASHDVAVSVPPAISVSAAERRHLTVLFCDLVGSTALSARLDPEELSPVLSAYRECCAVAVARFDGHIAKYLGDGVLACFGYPRAHEDDAERAVRAGLAIVESVSALAEHVKPALRSRVGIATGLVVVGDLIGSGEAQERGIVGETPNLAARLQTLAEPDTVLIAASTRRLVGGLFDCVDLGSHHLKGLPAAVQVWRVRGESGVESRFEALHGGGLTPLVGREEELALLLERWERVVEGEGQVVLLAGEPGIGKSRIIEALWERLRGAPNMRLRYFCSPHHQNSALHPVIEQLERAAGFRRGDPPEQKLVKLEALLTLSAKNVADVAPLFAGLLSIPADGRYPALNLSPQRQKEKTLETIADQLPGLAARQPVLLIWEDAHWSDPTSLELLDLIVDRVQSIPVLVIITFRPEFAPRWTGYAHATSLTLNRLSRKHVAAMIEHVTAGKALPREVSDQITAKTDGVPLFVEELTKTVLESGLLKDAGSRYALAGPLPSLAIPATLQDSLLARLDRLAPVKEVAQIGAVIGREFSYELLAAVAARPPEALRQALGDLVRAELVFGHGTPPYARYTFKHALVQDAAYRSLLRSRRQQWHAQIAHVMEERFPETVNTQPELLARHFTQAGLTEQAVPYWQKAGELAVARSAMVEAVAHLTQGLEALKKLSDTVERQRRELDLQVSLGGALVATKGFGASEVGRAWARAHELCRALGQPAQLLRVLYGQYTFHMVRAEFDRAREAAEELVRLGQTQHDTAAHSVGHRGIGVAQFYLGELVTSRQHFEQALGLDDPTRTSAFDYSYDTRVVSLSYLSLALFICGYPEQARTRSCEALTRARELSHPGSIAYAHSYRLILHELWGDARAALEDAEAVVSIATEQGFAFWLAWAMTTRGWALAAMGQPELGIAELRRGLTAWVRSGTKMHMSYLRALMADIRGIASHPKADRLHLLDRAIFRAEHTREHWIEAELHRRRGELLASGPDRDPSEAEACFRRTIAIARSQSARLWELRAVTSLGHLLHDQARCAEAYDLIAPVYSWFTEGFDTTDLSDARELLSTLQ